MQFTMPVLFDIAGDSPTPVMGIHGDMVGFSKTRVVWRYGFLPNSPNAFAFKLSTSDFTWIITTYKGKILDRWVGMAWNLPARYKKIINAKWGDKK